MPEPRNRRAETHARGLLKRAETLVGRASRHLFNGDPLVAMRMLRAAEHLNLLDSRLRIKRDAERKSLAARAADDMKERERACQQREELLEFVAKDIERRRAELSKTEAAVAAAYRLMREGPPAGPPPATEPETVSGVAPL
jgi:hypothetical protein